MCCILLSLSLSLSLSFPLFVKLLKVRADLFSRIYFITVLFLRYFDIFYLSLSLSSLKKIYRVSLQVQKFNRMTRRRRERERERTLFSEQQDLVSFLPPS